MRYTAVVTKEGKQTLAEFPGCPGCQTFADPGEDIAERARGGACRLAGGSTRIRASAA